MSKKKYHIDYKCDSCKYTYSRIFSYLPKKEPPCPQCKAANRARMKSAVTNETHPHLFGEALPTKHNFRFYCGANCNTKFYVETEKGNVPTDVICPECGTKENVKYSPMPSIITQQGQINNKAVDATAQIVMEDYKMTNLRDNVKAGESAAPKLPAAQQAMADNMFSGFKGNPALQQRAAKIKRQLANSTLAKMTPDVVGEQHQAKAGVKANIINNS